MEVGIFWKKLVHKCNERGGEGGINLKKSIKMEGGNVFGGWIFFFNLMFIRDVSNSFSSHFLSPQLRFDTI